MPWLESEDGKIFDLEDIAGVEWVAGDDPADEPTLEVVLRGVAKYRFRGNEATALHLRVREFRKPEPILPGPKDPDGAHTLAAPLPLSPRETGGLGG